MSAGRNTADIKYKLNTIDSEESLLGFNLFATNTIEFFEIQQEIAYDVDEDHDPNLAFIVSIDVPQDYTKYTRQIYNGLDFLGDVGGLKDGLHFMGTVLM